MNGLSHLRYLLLQLRPLFSVIKLTKEQKQKVSRTGSVPVFTQE